MNVERITISLSSLEPLHQYQNVKPEVSLMANVDAEVEDWQEVLATLTDTARGHLNRIIDDYRTRNGLALRYYEGETFTAYHWRFHQIGVVLIAPSGHYSRDERYPGIFSTYGDRTDREFEHQTYPLLREWLESYQGDFAGVVRAPLLDWMFDYLATRHYDIVVGKTFYTDQWNHTQEYARIPAGLWRQVRADYSDYACVTADQLAGWLAGKKLASIPTFQDESPLREWGDNLDRLSAIVRAPKPKNTPPISTDDADEDSDEDDEEN